MNSSLESIVPENTKGKATDLEQQIIAASREEALLVFSEAAQRMLNINKWHHIGSSVSAEFALTDSTGQKLERPAALGDFIKIDVLGPGSSAGDGYDWVYIEALEDSRNSDADEESVAMRVRACDEPGKAGKDVAHFFTSEATSTFMVHRYQNTVKSLYRGRNEVLNTDAGKVLDKVRNALIGGAALAGLSEIQWGTLIKAFLQQEE